MSDILLYQAEDGRTRIDVRLEDGTVWLSQSALAELYQVSKQNVSLHLKNVYAEGELDEGATVKDYLTVRTEGTRGIRRTVKHYNLDAILAVGYRVRSHRGTQFRRWATERLGEYLVKGFVLDDERLKNVGRPFGSDYFDELLERIRDIRASEKRFYQKVRDIYATSVDYDAKSPAAQLFFKKVQNKMLWAVTGRTAAELITDRADPGQPNMGLMTWHGSRVRRQDVTVAKNYLGKDEIEELNRVVTMYLDYAEDQARRRRQMTMGDWEEKLDAFLSFNERDILTHAGKVSAVVAEALALERYEQFDVQRREAERVAADREDVESLERIEREMRRRKNTGGD